MKQTSRAVAQVHKFSLRRLLTLICRCPSAPDTLTASLPSSACTPLKHGAINYTGVYLQKELSSTTGQLLLIFSSVTTLFEAQDKRSHEEQCWPIPTQPTCTWAGNSSPCACWAKGSKRLLPLLHLKEFVTKDCTSRYHGKPLHLPSAFSWPAVVHQEPIHGYRAFTGGTTGFGNSDAQGLVLNPHTQLEEWKFRKKQGAGSAGGGGHPQSCNPAWAQRALSWISAAGATRARVQCLQVSPDVPLYKGMAQGWAQSQLCPATWGHKAPSGAVSTNLGTICFSK